MPPDDDLIIKPPAEVLQAIEPPPVRKVNCTNCLFFQLRSGVGQPVNGSCHRIPPTSAVVGMQQHPLDARQQQPISMSFWPNVGINDWCGEFQNKKAKGEAVA